jgi:hypothetical protein
VLTALSGTILLLLLAGLLPATLLLTGLLAGLIALLLLARVRFLILVLTHSVFLQRCWLLRLEDSLRDSPANIITPRELLRSVCNETRELRAIMRVPLSMQNAQ